MCVKRQSIKSEPTNQKKRKMSSHPSTVSAFPVKTEEVDELDRLRQQVQHLQCEAEERSDEMDALCDDNRRLTRLVQSLQKDVKDRDAEIAALKSSPVEERIDRLEKHVARLQKKAKNRDSETDQLQKTAPTIVQSIKTHLARLKSMSEELNEADKATLTDNFDTFTERVSVRELMKGANDAVDSLVRLADQLAENICEDQLELDFRMDSVYKFVNGLLKEANEYYANVADHDEFIAQIDEKLHHRKDTLQRLFAEIEAVIGKHTDADRDDNDHAC
uniref:Translin n=1 Tax=Panagrellus redivivus TaxID=6233 RepID=A0A7E4UZ24_PANRE